MEDLLKALHNLNEELKKAKNVDSKSKKALASEAVKFEKNGQWKLVKADPKDKASAAKDKVENPAEVQTPAAKVKVPADPKDKAKAPAADPAAAALAEDPVVKFEKNGQWSLKADKIKPGRENSRKIPKEEK